jgi:hypothetical protein
MGNPVMTAIMMVLRLGIGLILLRLALNPRSRNLHWLAACFYLNFFVLFLTGSVVSQAVVIAIQICLAMFTHTTFYRDRRSPIRWVIGALLLGGGASLYLWQPVPGNIGMRLMFAICALNWSWHALVAWQVWRKLTPDRMIEDWIKARYAMVVAYAAMMSLLFLYPLLPMRGGSMVFYRWAFPVTMVASVVLQYLAWGMPGVLRRFLNRNYRRPAGYEQVRGMTEEDVLRALEQEQHPAR